MMDKVQELLSRCKCGCYITINAHRNVYATAEQGLESLSEIGELPDIDDDVLAIMIATDTIVDIHFYPDTPVGSYRVLHYDLELAASDALTCLDDVDSQ